MLFGSYDVSKLQKKLKHKLKDSRYQHSLGASYTACCLAMKYNEDIEKALVAGLLHDCGKYMTSEEMYSFCLKKKIEMNVTEKIKPDLLHAKIGAYLANKRYHIKDNSIKNAILCHTTGKPDMTTFEKIIYISDYIEPNRNKMPRLDEIRKMAFEDLDKCLSMILEDTLAYLKEVNSEIDDLTQKTYDFYHK